MLFREITAAYSENYMNRVCYMGKIQYISILKRVVLTVANELRKVNMYLSAACRTFRHTP
jgi:hypothetical protein